MTYTWLFVFRSRKRGRAGATADEVPIKRAKARLDIPPHASPSCNVPTARSLEQQQQAAERVSGSAAHAAGRCAAALESKLKQSLADWHLLRHTAGSACTQLEARTPSSHYCCQVTHLRMLATRQHCWDNYQGECTDSESLGLQTSAAQG